MKKEIQNKKDVVFKEREAYKEKILMMLEEVNDVKTLQYLHRFVKLFLNKWG